MIASDDGELARRLQETINSTCSASTSTTTSIGVELCAAAKNVIALAAGAVDGLGLGDNAKAALVTRGLVEMARLGEALGADPETFSGLAGMGDLMVTCWHPAGRNRRAGELIAQGATPRGGARPRSAGRRGPTTAPVLRDVSHRHGIELPITEGVCAVLDGRRCTSSPASLMGRRPDRRVGSTHRWRRGRSFS